ELVHAGWEAERLFGGPQDIEWAKDKKGTLFLLQSRPMQLEDFSWEVTEQDEDLPAQPLLIGMVLASAGVGCGPVHFLSSPKNLNAVPKGCVLVVESLDPALSRIVDRVEAVIAESGSRASHFASIAREFGIPVISGTSSLNEVLEEGMEVTVDAMQGRVYPERISTLLESSMGEPGPRTKLSERLDSVMPKLIKLNLTDHASDRFTPENCRSLHDLVRYVHEKGVSEMFSLVGKGSRAMAKSKKLHTELPIVVYILDLGGGIFQTAKDKDVISPDDVRSSPMNAIWWGLSAQDIKWNEEQLHIDWEEFDRISAGIFSADSRLLASYAILDQDYVHLMIRFGYHFCILDALSGSNEKNNYINFRFKGGGGSFEQRIFRLTFISGVLSHYGFEVQTKGDKLDARIRSLNEAATQKRLAVLGYLLARTKLMDVELEGNAEAAREVQTFLQSVEKRES
ncbi:MAG: PEP-utilizing enzyme, partial [Desulfovibrionales bacterium]